MSENNNPLSDIRVETEELIGPPKIDLVGIGMMLLVAVVVGFLSSIGIVIFIENYFRIVESYCNSLSD